MKRFTLFTSTKRTALGAVLVTFITACGGGSSSGNSTSVATISEAEHPEMVLQGRKFKAPTPDPAPTPAEIWNSCANEGGSCLFSGTRQVRYGANGTYFYRTATGSIQCTNSVFGDPLPTVFKTCAYSSNTTTVPAPAPAPAPAPVDGGRIVTPEFFGMHLAAQTHEGWPSVKFGIQRTWDSWPGVSWSDLNPSSGAYNWAPLDALVNDSVAHGVELVYTFGHVPQWASTNPSGNCDGSPAGDCFAPQAQAWRDFVSQITSRYKGKIKYWELWNEPNAGNFWKGTHPQLVEMARNAYPIIKNAGGTVLSPSPQGTSSHTWIDAYLSAGGGSYLDIVTFHGYLYGPPEYLNALVTNIRTVQSKHGLSDKPLWDTEHSWGDKTWPMGADQDQQSAWLARFIVLSFFHGIERSFWYGWEHFNWGSLFDRTTDTILKPGIAYREVYSWMIGASFNPCQISGSVYQCRITRANGYEGVIAWNGGGTSNFTVPSGYSRVRTLDATASAVSGGQVINIGAKPVLVEKPY